MFRKLSLILMLAFLVIAGNTKAAYYVYWKPSTGSDSNVGTNVNSSVKTLAKAIEVLKAQYQEDPTGNWIIFQMEQWVIANTDNGEIVIDGKIDDTHNALVLRQPDMHDYMIKYTETTNSSGANTLKLSNITFNGNSIKTQWPASASENQNKPIIVIGQNRKVIMEDGCVLTNNQQTHPAEEVLNGAGVVINDGATLVMNGGEISNCKANNAGGGVYSAGGAIFTMNGGKIDGCYAFGTNSNGGYKGEGGGVYLNKNSQFTMNGGEICNCQGRVYGGGIRLVSGESGKPTTGTINKGYIHDNRADDNPAVGRGGGMELSGSVTLTIDGSEAIISDNHANYYGGGLQISGGGATVNFKNGIISSNSADNGAGGVHVTGGASFIMEGGKIDGNHSNVLGGGIHSSGDCNLEIHGGEIANNYANIQAGAININTGSAVVIDDTSSPLSIHDNRASVGGAFCVNGATLTVNGGTYYNNQADETLNSATDNRGKGRGGFVYVDSRNKNSTTNSQGNFIFNSGSIYNNTATNFGGAVFIAEKDPDNPPSASNNSVTTTAEIHGGIIGMEGAGNKALVYDGGGLYCQPKTAFVMDNINAIMQYNEAGRNGGGLAIGTNATVTMTAGTISHNKAGSQGGGIYIPNNSTFILSGSAIISNNDVTDASGLGGGVYMGGSMQVKSGSLAVRDNTVNGSKPCNVYLPASHTIQVMDANFRPDYLGIYVADGQTAPIPVLSATTANYSWLQTIYSGMQNNTMNVFDDKQQYSPILRDVAISEMKAIWFDNSTPWSLQQQQVAATDLHMQDNVCQISDVKSLTAFLWHVNGISKHSTAQEFANANPNAQGILTADIDMGSQYWVPIGTSVAPFEGKLDGNGHVITNLVMSPTNASTNYGLMGHIKAGAVIENVILEDCNFSSGTGATNVGSIVAQMDGGTVRNCYSTSVVSSTVANCNAGGLVGNLVSGNLINNMSYPKLVISGNCLAGGLVGNNSGTVENCYVRGLKAGSTTGSQFGWLVGNTSGNVDKSYAPDGTYSYAFSGTVGTYCGIFTPANIFSFNIDADNRVGDTRLVGLLNEYVAHVNANKEATLDNWVLPTTTAVNAGLPVLRYDGTIAVGSTDGIALHYANNEDELVAMINNYATGGISLYANADLSEKTINQGNATFAIHPSASILQGVNSSNIRALVSIAMQYTSGTKYYHGISSSIQSWPLGFVYGNESKVSMSYLPNPCLVSIGINNGIFPHDINPSGTMTEDSSLPWDFYDFQESTSHWVNYRRNSLSHWNELTQEDNLNYTNHTELNDGKGYLVAINLDPYDNDSILLQHEGTLNYNPIAITVTKTDEPYNYFPGINMIGNPYESYLNFNAFAEENKSLWEGTPFYAIYDKDNGFVYYSQSASKNTRTASQYIHKHQGFFVELQNCNSTSNAMGFDNSMRSNDGNPDFREWVRNYPLVNLIVTDSNGEKDICVVEMNRNDFGGANKLAYLTMSDGVIYARQNNQDYSIVFTDGCSSTPIWFEAREESTYRLTWETLHGEFNYLHLIDNLSGIDIDMLATQEYQFTGTPNDFKSRFKLLCQCTGLDENEAQSDAPFAFVCNGQLVVNGEGTLQLIDLNGRVLLQNQLEGTTNSVSLPVMSNGLYILKLNNKTQKIVLH